MSKELVWIWKSAILQEFDEELIGDDGTALGCSFSEVFASSFQLEGGLCLLIFQSMILSSLNEGSCFP